MDGLIARRDIQHPGGDGSSTQPHEAQQPSGGNQAYGDVTGTPLPWSRDSVVRWAQQNGFAKFIPALIQHGIEGRQFYTLRLETMRDMRIPNVSMQDLIQLNAAIYRLNASGAAVAAAPRPQVQAQPQPLHPPPLPPQLQPQVPSPNQNQEPVSNSQILSHPLQPLRPPRPSWTLRRDDPQPTYSHQVQLTANGMVARPVRVRPPVTYSQQQQQPPPHSHTQQPLDPALQLQNAQREGAGLPSVPFSINTEVAPMQEAITHQAATATAGSTSTAKTWTSRLGPSPRSPYREGQTAAANNAVPSGSGSATGERTPRYNTGLSTYRSRNSAHVEIDELPFVRPGQSAWSPQLQPQAQPPPPPPPQGSLPPTQQRFPLGSFAALGNPPRRRSAVIDVVDDLAQLSAEQPAPEPSAPRVPRLTPAPLPPRLAPTLPAITTGAASGSPAIGLPARYHGTNQPHSPYYAHGASATAGSFSYRGVSSPASVRPAYATVPQSGGSRYAPVDLSSSAEPGRYLTRRTAGARQHGGRSGMRGLFEQNSHSPVANPPVFANTTTTTAVSSSSVSRPPLVSDNRKPHPYSKEAAARARRTSISPVLNALKPGNYHIANLPDDLDSSSSDVSDSSVGRRIAHGSLSAPNHNTNVPIASSSNGGSKFPFLPGSAPPAIITSIFARDFGISPCDTGDSTVTPLSVVNVLPGTFISPYTSPQTQAGQVDGAVATMPTESGSANSNNHVRLQMAFGGDVEDLPSAGLRRTGTHLRSPSMPASLETSILGSEHSGASGGATNTNCRPHSTVDQVIVDPMGIDQIRHHELDNDLSDGSQAIEKGAMTIFDAESMNSADDDGDGSMSVNSHFDLVENAASVTWSEERRDDEPSIFDAEDIGDPSSAPAMDIFDAEEVEYSDDGDFGDRISSSPVRIDAYETESIFSVPATHYEHEVVEQSDGFAWSDNVMAAQNGGYERQEQVSPPLQRQASDAVITLPSLSSGGAVSNTTTPTDNQQQQDSSAFKVKGVRHVLSYGADFDKTAATLLSSIKTNIAKKAAATGSSTTSRPVPNMPNAASIAAAIELHQLKQQQQQQQQQLPIPRRQAADDPGGSLSAERHTSRLSGFFGFGPRAHKHHQTPSPSTAASTTQQQLVAAPTSLPQSQHLTLGASGSTSGLRVVTDFQSLRGGSSAVGAAIGNTDPSSAEGKKSASPSTLPRRWRVPFRPRTTAAAAAGLSGEHAYSQQLSGESPSSLAVDKGHESEVSTSATPRTESASQRTLRRSRYRAGTTSDIESPLTAAALLSTMDRPYSMVESVSSASATSAGGSALTPGSATTSRLPQPPQLLPPGAPQTAPKTIAGSGKSGRRVHAHFQHSTSPISPLVGRMFRDGHRQLDVAISEDMSPPADSAVPLSSVFVRREQDTEFVQVDISRLMSGAAVAERLVRTLNGGGGGAMPLPLTPGMLGEYRFAVQSADGGQWLLNSDGELWTHCVRARPESPAAFVLCDGDSYQQHQHRDYNRRRLRFQPTRQFGDGEDGDEPSSSGSESEICSAVPPPLFGGRMPPPFARSALASDSSGCETGSVSPSSFVTANSSSSPIVALGAASRGIGQLALSDDVAPDSSPSSLSRADSWTLMFVNKEFVVAKPSHSSQGTISSATLTTDGGNSSGLPTPMQVMDAESDNGESDEGGYGDDDADLWGGAAPITDRGDVIDDDPVAEAMRADLAELRAVGEGDIDIDDDSRSIASSTRTLPSTMRFTRGMRATLLERRPSRNMHGRPTADVIGEQLDEYFPDHDLDRPIVQSVPMDEGMLPSQEFHIILDEDDGTPTAAYQGRGQAEMHGKHRRQMLKTLGSDDDGNDSAVGGPLPGSGIGRRKSVRMLVQETRHQRQQRRPRSRVVVDRRTAVAEPVVAKPPRPVMRRQSTKLWGCIPEEIRPRDERIAATMSVQSGVPRGNDEIVRRALSLLRKPEPNPQAEKEIVEAAIKYGDNSTVGSTRAHFAHERARMQLRAMADDSGEADDMALQMSSGGGSVNDAARALFAKYGIAMAGIKIQWIKGKLIGKGSFGHVYVAINAATGEVIAVKQIRLPASLCAATDDTARVGSSRRRRSGRAAGLLEEAIRMMYTEVELLRDLDHENVVQLLGFEVAGGVMSMFLEYVPGGTVQSLVQQHGPLPESVVHSFLRQIVAGLGYLHASGILHRDIKGANILVDETGTCKISDFGVSRKVDYTSLAAAMSGSGDNGLVGGSARKKSIKAAGKILGTVPFMAPEVARSSQYTAAADIWSLGCVVVQMWSGRGPWDELQEPQVFFKLGRGEAPPIPDDLTEPGLEFCKNCFAADPLARWTAAELGCMQFAQVPREYEYPYAC